MSKRHLCFIPARGGSKRLPHKNLLPIAGKPLLAYTIEVALESRLYDDIVVSSEDAEILRVSASLGVTIDLRPVALSSDGVHSVHVIMEYLERANQRDRYETVSKLLPTCPLRSVDDLQGAYKRFDELHQTHAEPFLISVFPYDFPPQYALHLDLKSGRLQKREPPAYDRHSQTQDLEVLFRPNGAVYIATVEGLLRAGTFFEDPLFGYEMPAERSLDIDYRYQFDIIKTTIESQKKEIHWDAQNQS